MQEKLVREVLKGVRLLHLAGGESFASKLHMHLLTSIDCMQYPDMKILIQTNGLLITPETERISGIRDAIKYISISIDAANPETYRELRRGGDFDQLIKNMEFIASLRIKGKLERLEFSFVVQRRNYSEMKQFIDMGKKYGVDAVSFTRIYNRASESEEEFLAKAIHDKNNLEHQRFLDIIRDPVFKDPIVIMNNLSDFLRDEK